MGRVLVTAKIENLGDLFSVEKQLITPDQVRRVEVTDALVDTGASTLGLPKAIIERLGLLFMRVKRARTAAGQAEVRMFGTVRLTVQDREAVLDVTELPDDCPVLIGQIPLEMMDFVVDPANHRLIGDPRHGGEQIIELY